MVKAYPLARSDRPMVEPSGTDGPHAAPDSDLRSRGAEKLSILYCRSKSEIEKLEDPQRKTIIRGDLIR